MLVFLKNVLVSSREVSWNRLPLCMVTSKKSTESSLISCVYFKVGWCWLRFRRKVSRVSLVSVQIVNTSSMYRFHMRGLMVCVVRKSCSILCMKVLA